MNFISIDKCERAFTLVEIAVAIAILGVGLATLMGTSVRLMDATYQEINRANASLYASYLLEVTLAREDQASRGFNRSAGMSSSEQGQIGQGNSSGSLSQELSQLGYFDGFSVNEMNTTDISNWTFELIRMPLDIPLIPIPPQHIILTIRWGSEAHESYTLETIRPPVQNEAQNEEGSGI